MIIVLAINTVVSLTLIKSRIIGVVGLLDV